MDELYIITMTWPADVAALRCRYYKADTMNVGISAHYRIIYILVQRYPLKPLWLPPRNTRNGKPHNEVRNRPPHSTLFNPTSTYLSRWRLSWRNLDEHDVQEEVQAFVKPDWHFYYNRCILDKGSARCCNRLP